MADVCRLSAFFYCFIKAAIAVPFSTQVAIVDCPSSSSPKRSAAFQQSASVSNEPSAVFAFKCSPTTSIQCIRALAFAFLVLA